MDKHKILKIFESADVWFVEINQSLFLPQLFRQGSVGGVDKSDQSWSECGHCGAFNYSSQKKKQIPC